MKIILTPSTFIVFLAIGLLGISNSSNISSNIGNVFAQTDPENPPVMEEDKNISIMTMSKNQSEPEMVNWTGTIHVESTIGEAFKPKVNVNMIDAIKAALVNVGLNSTVKEAELTHAHNYLVYKIMVIDEDMKEYKVIVDPGNGEVFMKKEITWCDEHEKMKYGEKGDMYGHDNKMG
ncbi:MAG: PepSY domain-containing protein [Nitrososphaeraceae archaeon]